MTDDLLVVRLTLPLLARGELAIARSAGASRAQLSRVRRTLACSPSERRFARALLERRTNLWLFRTGQQAFAGDFLVIDASSPRIDSRRALVLELKDREPVRGVSAGMHQVRNAPRAVAAAARLTGVTSADSSYAVLRGDPECLLRLLRASPGVRTPRRFAFRELGSFTALP